MLRYGTHTRSASQIHLSADETKLLQARVVKHHMKGLTPFLDRSGSTGWRRTVAALRGWTPHPVLPPSTKKHPSGAACTVERVCQPCWAKTCRNNSGDPQTISAAQHSEVLEHPLWRVSSLSLDECHQRRCGGPGTQPKEPWRRIWRALSAVHALPNVTWHDPACEGAQLQLNLKREYHPDKQPHCLCPSADSPLFFEK